MYFSLQYILFLTVTCLHTSLLPKLTVYWKILVWDFSGIKQLKCLKYKHISLVFCKLSGTHGTNMTFTVFADSTGFIQWVRFTRTHGFWETWMCYMEYHDRNQDTVTRKHLIQVSEPSHMNWDGIKLWHTRRQTVRHPDTV